MSTVPAAVAACGVHPLSQSAAWRPPASVQSLAHPSTHRPAPLTRTPAHHTIDLRTFQDHDREGHRFADRPWHLGCTFCSLCRDNICWGGCCCPAPSEPGLQGPWHLVGARACSRHRALPPTWAPKALHAPRALKIWMPGMAGIWFRGLTLLHPSQLSTGPPRSGRLRAASERPRFARRAQAGLVRTHAAFPAARCHVQPLRHSAPHSRQASPALMPAAARLYHHSPVITAAPPHGPPTEGRRHWRLPRRRQVRGIQPRGSGRVRPRARRVRGRAGGAAGDCRPRERVPRRGQGRLQERERGARARARARPPREHAREHLQYAWARACAHPAVALWPWGTIATRPTGGRAHPEATCLPTRSHWPPCPPPPTHTPPGRLRRRPLQGRFQAFPVQPVPRPQVQGAI